jgi:hypothetical protein
VLQKGFNAEKTAAAAITLCTYIDAHRKLWTTLFVGGAAESVRRTLIDLSRKVSHAHVDSEGWPPKEVAVAIFVASTVELLTWWLQQKDRTSRRFSKDSLSRRRSTQPSITNLLRRKNHFAGSPKIPAERGPPHPEYLHHLLRCRTVCKK